MIRKAVVALATCVLAVVASLSLGSAAGAQYQPVCSVTASPTSVAPGGTVTLSGFVDDGVESRARVPDQEIVFSIGDIELGSTTTDEDGEFSTEVTIPADLAPGTYTITADCGEFGGQDILGNVDINVTGDTPPPPTTPGGGGQGGNQGGGSTGGGSTGGGSTGGGSDGAGGGNLARTGTDLGLPVQIGVALLALGGIALALSASRRRSGATA